MKQNDRFRREQTILYVILAAALAFGGVGAFLRTFLNWAPVPYAVSVAVLALSFAALVWVRGKAAGKPRAIVGAAVAFACFLAGAFGLTFLINNVILRAVHADIAACIMAGVFSLAILGAAAAALAVSGKPLPVRAGVAAVCAGLLAANAPAALKPLLPEKYDHPFENKIAETSGLPDAPGEKLIVNLDDSHWWGWLTALADGGDLSDEAVNAYVMQYADTGVTDLIFNILAQTSDVPTEALTFRGDLYGQTEQNGLPVDYSPYRGLSLLYKEYGVDIFAKWFERCREVGIRPWISLRMNDCHDPDEDTSVLRGDLFYTARENGWTIGEEYGYYRNCFNYAVPEIREIMLRYTREQLMQYDVYGLELDFMREIYCFDYLNADQDEIVSVMNGYMRDTAAIVKEAEAHWGHPIRLAVRLMRDLDECRVFGFDPLQWQQEGLVDVITVTPRFDTCDSAMPIADWVRRLPDVEIWAGIETNVCHAGEGMSATAEVVRGYAAQYLTAGAKGTYLFNYMSAGEVQAREAEVYDTCRSLESILPLPRRHIVTRQDLCPKGWEPYDPLPLRVKKNPPAVLQVETGYIPENARVEVYLGFASAPASPESLSLEVCGRECAFAGESTVMGRNENGTSVENSYCGEGTAVFRFDLPAGEPLPNLLTLSLSSPGGSAKLTYAEVRVEPQQ